MHPTEPVLPYSVRSPGFRAASELIGLVEQVAASLPPEWRFLAVHLRRGATFILQSLALSGGVSGKRRRKLVAHARLRAFDLVGALQAAASAPGVNGPRTGEAATACLRLVRLLAPAH
jgi:hypothetical protein